MVINASFSWLVLGNKPAPKRNGLKQPSFYLLMILWVSSLVWGQALRGPSAGVLGPLRQLQSAHQELLVLRQGLANFLSTLSFSSSRLSVLFLFFSFFIKEYLKRFGYCGKFHLRGLRWRHHADLLKFLHFTKMSNHHLLKCYHVPCFTART